MSVRQVYLVDSAKQQFRHIAGHPSLAWIVGWRSGHRIEILNVVRMLSKNGEILRTTDKPYSVEQELNALDEALPYGIVPLGCAAVYGDSIPMSVALLFKSLKFLSAYAVKRQNQSKTETSVSIVWVMNELYSFVDDSDADVQDIPSSESQFLASHLRTQWKMEMVLPLFSEGDGQNSKRNDPFLAVCDELERDKSLIFCLQQHSGKHKKIWSRTSPVTLEKCYGDCKDEVQGVVLRSTEQFGLQCPSIQMQTISSSAGLKLRGIRTCLHLICYLPSSLPFSTSVERHLLPSIRSKLRHFSQALDKDSSISEVCSLHFDLEGLVVPVCVVYPFVPESAPHEEPYKEKRKQLHRRFLQKGDSPLFKHAQAIEAVSSRSTRPVATTSSAQVSTNKLLNVHKHLPEKNFPEGGMMAMVTGTYEYCHYGHDNVNDSGWGCAYRSLQTVFSWYIHQGHTNLSIPSHKRIQEILIEVGDKEPSFYGSREWIGSIEVGTVLNEMLGVSYRVLTKSAHQDVASVARQLVHHFQTHGTPVSIGGGVLAYTLLGVYFNDQTAEVELLILDPHYTGKDDPSAIVKGRWIAWKKTSEKAAAGGPLFVPNTHYNFMCPSRSKDA